MRKVNLKIGSGFGSKTSHLSNINGYKVPNGKQERKQPKIH